jgi:hypothetical protein
MRFPTRSRERINADAEVARYHVLITVFGHVGLIPSHFGLTNTK